MTKKILKYKKKNTKSIYNSNFWQFYHIKSNYLTKEDTLFY